MAIKKITLLTRKIFSLRRLRGIFLLSFLFCSSPLLADSQGELLTNYAQQEVDINVGNEETSLLNAYLIVPIRWVDNAVTEVFAMLIPIRGVSAASNAGDIMKKVKEAIEGSNANFQKNPDVVADAVEAAKNGLAFQNELIGAQLANLDFQSVLKKNQEIIASINQQFKQKVMQDDLSALLYQKSEQIKDFYEKNPSLLKSLFARIINSDLGENLKEKAREMLTTLNSGVSILDQREMIDLFGAVIKSGGGGTIFIICETGCAVIGGLAVGVPTGGVGALQGAAMGIIECGPLCATAATAGIITGGMNAGFENMHFREEQAKSAKKQDAEPSANQDKSNGVTINQMEQQVRKGQAPKTIERVDGEKVRNGRVEDQAHVHFQDGSALNKDGTWKHGSKQLSNEEKEWLGKAKDWRLPNE